MKDQPELAAIEEPRVEILGRLDELARGNAYVLSDDSSGGGKTAEEDLVPFAPGRSTPIA